MIMTRLKELYDQLKNVQKRQPTGTASAMQRHQHVAELQRKIDYYEQGDTISRTFIQQEMAEIHAVQQEIDKLTAVKEDKKRALMKNVFGEHLPLV
ncbi:hypothetical protein ACFSFY_12480 [Sporosarcina siberiensis]|uniref:Uncharacterized protein n=1 Tax=Sporosarcina siberiensis TaxID=1365606 RepID=A0ABW4SIN2_9BACL